MWYLILKLTLALLCCMQAMKWNEITPSISKYFGWSLESLFWFIHYCVCNTISAWWGEQGSSRSLHWRDQWLCSGVAPWHASHGRQPIRFLHLPSQQEGGVSQVQLCDTPRNQKCFCSSVQFVKETDNAKRFQCHLNNQHCKLLPPGYSEIHVHLVIIS